MRAASVERIPVEMTTATSNGTTFKGHLQLIDNQVDARSGTVRVRAVFDNADGHLMPGQFARLRMGQAKTGAALLVSERAVGTDQNKKFVMVVDADSKAAYREVYARGIRRRHARRVERPAGRRAHHRERAAARPSGRAGRAADWSRWTASRRRRRQAQTFDRSALTPKTTPRHSIETAYRRWWHDMNFSKFFIDRPIFAGVLSVLIFISGLLALRVMPISEYPEVVPPSVIVRAQYPGANPKVIAETVATPIEEAINGVEGMLYMSSQATTDGLMTLTVTFKLGTDPDKAQQLVQNRVSQAEPRLPEEVRRLGVTTIKSAPDLTMVVHLLSPNNRYDMTYLRNYAVLNVKDRLARIEGVGQVQLFGAGDYSMRVWLDPQKVAERGLSASDVVQRDPGAERAGRRRRRRRFARLAGSRPPAFHQCPGPPAERGGIRRDRRQDRRQWRDHAPARHRPHRARRIRVCPALAAGQQVRRRRSDLPGARLQRPRHLRQRPRSVMADIKKNMPEGVDYQIVYDPTQFVRASIEAVVHTLLEAIALVVLVVIVFLQTWRASIIPLLAVPVSIIGTFAVMYVFGFSINALSLFGLVLAIGIVVDDAIVVVENVERNIEEGLSPREAAYRAMSEVSGPIVAIALVLIAVFVPLAFISGLTGQFYRQFALTIAISTVISAINSLTLSPALAALLLKSHDAPKDALTRIMDRLFGWFFRGFNTVFRARLQCLQRQRRAHHLAQGR